MSTIGVRFNPPFAGPLDAAKAALTALADSLRQELAPWAIRVILVEPASINSGAADKVSRDAAAAMAAASPQGRALYEATFRSMLTVMARREDNGSSPDVPAATIARALTARHPRTMYLTGKDARRLALLEQPAGAGTRRGQAAGVRSAIPWLPRRSARGPVSGQPDPADRQDLLTVGHGTHAQDAFALLRSACLAAVVDVRIAPGSRRFPQFSRGALEHWLPGCGFPTGGNEDSAAFASSRQARQTWRWQIRRSVPTPPTCGRVSSPLPSPCWWRMPQRGRQPSCAVRACGGAATGV